MGSEEKLQPEYTNPEPAQYDILLHDNDELVVGLYQTILENLDTSEVSDFREIDVINTHIADDLDDAKEKLTKDDKQYDIFVTGLKGNYKAKEAEKETESFFETKSFSQGNGKLEDEESEYPALNMLDQLSDHNTTVCTVLSMLEPDGYQDIGLESHTNVDTYFRKPYILNDVDHEEWASYLISLARYGKTKRGEIEPTPENIIQNTENLDLVNQAPGEKSSDMHLI